MMILSYAVLLTMFLPCLLIAQPYVDAEATQHRFAQTYIGTNAQYIAGTGTTFGSQSTGPVSLPARLTPRITIGALHFWGHADFYVTFPIPPHGFEGASGNITSTTSTGIETGARFYPWRLEWNTIRPFAGINWSILSYAQRDGSNNNWGPTYFRHRAPLQAGISWMIEQGILDIGAMWIPGSDITYPVTRNRFVTVDLPDVAAWIGFKYMFDATLGAAYATKRGIIEEMQHEMDSTGELSTWTVASGISTAFTLSESSHNVQHHGWLDRYAISPTFPDISLGYYFHAPDMMVNISYRPISQDRDGYNFTQSLSRLAVSLEACKFLFDYNGFVPFIGASFGLERLRLYERDNGRVILNQQKTLWHPSIVFGWDIRPTPVDWFILRTNLRYSPELALTTEDGTAMGFDQLEFNFIQFVLYPERIF